MRAMLQAITMLTLAQADTAAAPAADQAQASGGAVEHAFNLVQALPIEAHAAPRRVDLELAVADRRDRRALPALHLGFPARGTR